MSGFYFFVSFCVCPLFSLALFFKLSNLFAYEPDCLHIRGVIENFVSFLIYKKIIKDAYMKCLLLFIVSPFVTNTLLQSVGSRAKHML